MKATPFHRWMKNVHLPFRGHCCVTHHKSVFYLFKTHPIIVLQLPNIKEQRIWHLLWCLLSPDMENFLIELFISFTYNSSYMCMSKYIIVRPGLGTGCSVWQTGLGDTATAPTQINNWWLLVICKISGAQGLPERPAALFTSTTALAWEQLCT